MRTSPYDLQGLGATTAQMAQYNLSKNVLDEQSQVAFRAFGLSVAGAVLGFLILGRKWRSKRSAVALALPVLGVGGIYAFQHYQYASVVLPP
jgi:hypothetical protein